MRRYVIEYRTSSASEWELDTKQLWNKDTMEIEAETGDDAVELVMHKLIEDNQNNGYEANYYNDDTVMICKPDGSLHEVYSSFNIVKRI